MFYFSDITHTIGLLLIPQFHTWNVLLCFYHHNLQVASLPLLLTTSHMNVRTNALLAKKSRPEHTVFYEKKTIQTSPRLNRLLYEFVFPNIKWPSLLIQTFFVSREPLKISRPRPVLVITNNQWNSHVKLSCPAVSELSMNRQTHTWP